MPISPCNSLNVKTIRISQLASVSSTDLTGNDVIYLSQYDNTNNVYYSKRTTLADLTNYFNIQGNLSGSFSGSFYGKVYSKNTISTGSFSGSYWGRINSKNTKATGSFSGSHYGNITSKNTKATGSFSGSHYGGVTSKNTKATGSFKGVFYGNATTSTTSTTSNTSSYLLQTTQNTSDQLGYFDGTRLTSTPGLYISPYAGGYKLLKLSSSMALSYYQVFSRGVTVGGVRYNQSGLSLFNLNSNESYPNIDGWNIISGTSGSLVLSAPIGSYEFSNSNVVAKSTSGECYGMVQKRNGFYFWPYMGANTPARDGAIGIGVQPPTEPTGSFNQYLRAKLHISCYSGSGEGPWTPKATVENRAVAILVQYGSGSATTSPYNTFYVSASGNTYMKGTLTVDKAITSSLTPIGTGTSLPANVKYIPINVNGTIYKLPLYS